MKKRTIAIVGYGSIGKRHAENLKEFDQTVIPLDVGYKLRFDVDCAFICSPTQFHIKHALEYLDRQIPVFIEKPLTYCIEELDYLARKTQNNSTLSMVGCNLRFHPSILKAKAVAESKRVIFARAETGYYLPFWRQGDYKQTYSASEYGGVIIDAIHEPDYLYWLFGDFKDIKTVCAKVSDLEIKKEDISETSIIFKSGVAASVHCDYLMKNYHRKLDLYMPHEVITYRLMPTNIMYKKEVEYFLECLDKNIQPMNGIQEASYVLKKILESGSYNSGKVDQQKVAA